MTQLGTTALRRSGTLEGRIAKEFIWGDNHLRGQLYLEGYIYFNKDIMRQFASKEYTKKEWLASRH